MSAQISRPIGVLTFACVLSVIGAVGTTNTAIAADCLTAPSSSTPSNGHWYYRTDRSQQRKCWFLRTDNQEPEQKSASANQPSAEHPQPASSPPYSLDSFRAFMTQRMGARPSDHDVETLYAEFLEWNRKARN